MNLRPTEQWDFDENGKLLVTISAQTIDYYYYYPEIFSVPYNFCATNNE